MIMIITITVKAFEVSIRNEIKLPAVTNSWENAFTGSASPAVSVWIHPAWRILVTKRQTWLTYPHASLSCKSPAATCVSLERRSNLSSVCPTEVRMVGRETLISPKAEEAKAQELRGGRIKWAAGLRVRRRHGPSHAPRRENLSALCI